MTDRVAGLVLAGGEGRRMGGIDKPLLDLGGRPMLARVIDALGTAVTAISANGDPTRFAAFGLAVLPDGAFAGQGPLAGILAGLEWADRLGMTALLTAPGDMPFLPRGLNDRLQPSPRGVRSGGRTQQLVALWPTSCATSLRAVLSVPGSRRVADFAAMIGMHYDEFTIWSEDSFVNINTRDDLAKARVTVSHGDTPGPVKQ